MAVSLLFPMPYSETAKLRVKISPRHEYLYQIASYVTSFAVGANLVNKSRLSTAKLARTTRTLTGKKNC